MQEHFSLNPAFSIIYHSEDTVEFRSGVWNVISHVLNDDAHQGQLAKVILKLEENPTVDITQFCKVNGVKSHEYTDIINTLKQKDILLSQSTSKPIGRFSATLPQAEKMHYIPKKIKIIDDGQLSKLLFNLLRSAHPDIEITWFTETELALFSNQDESLFRDALLLEKTIEKCQNLLADTLVISINSAINPIFYMFLNKILYESHIPWFFAAHDGPFIYVGPLFTDIFCYECLENRILMNTKKNADYLNFKKALLLNKVKPAKPNIDAAIQSLVCALASLEINSYLNTGRCIATHKILSLYLPTMEFSYHKILKLPGCRICGTDNALHGHQVHFDTGALLR